MRCSANELFVDLSSARQVGSLTSLSSKLMYYLTINLSYKTQSSAKFRTLLLILTLFYMCENNKNDLIIVGLSIRNVQQKKEQSQLFLLCHCVEKM